MCTQATARAKHRIKDPETTMESQGLTGWQALWAMGQVPSTWSMGPAGLRTLRDPVRIPCPCSFTPHDLSHPNPPNEAAQSREPDFTDEAQDPERLGNLPRLHSW